MTAAGPAPVRAGPAPARLITRPLLVRFVSVAGTAALTSLTAAGFGVLALHTGYPAAFALTAAVMPAVLAAAGAPRRRGGRRPDRSG